MYTFKNELVQKDYHSVMEVIRERMGTEVLLFQKECEGILGCAYGWSSMAYKRALLVEKWNVKRGALEALHSVDKEELRDTYEEMVDKLSMAKLETMKKLA
jgi:hypothetical protein